MPDQKLRPRISNPPKPSGYEFVDEKWKLHTVFPERLYIRLEDGHFRPSRPLLLNNDLVPRVRPQTMAEKAAKADIELWTSSASVEEYEKRKKKLLKQSADAAGRRPTFHLFDRLPIELRWNIWRYVMEDQPTTITVYSAGYTTSSSSFGRPGVRTYQATAFLPPLLLVNHESHALARKHYRRRAFRGINGGGGVLTAYPTILRLEMSVLPILAVDNHDLDLVEELYLVAAVSFNRSIVKTPLKVWGAIFKNKKLKKLEVRSPSYGTENERYVNRLVSKMETQFALARVADREWVAPEIRIVRTGGGTPDEVIYSFAGGLLATMPRRYSRYTPE